LVRKTWLRQLDIYRSINWGLATVMEALTTRRALTALALRQGAGSEEAKAWADELAGPVPWTLPALRRRWNAAKGVTTGAFGVLDHRHLRLPRIGAVRTKESTTKLAERLGDGSARIVSATVSSSAGRWYVSFGCRVERPAAEPARTDAVVGVDVGVRSLAVVSTGEVVANPKHLSRYARRMARQQRQCARRQGPARRRLRRSAGGAPRPRWPPPTPRWLPPAPTACTSSPPAWPPPTARSSSRTSTSPG